MSTVMYGGIAISTATPMGKELESWETKNRIPGWRPENYQYPKMLYRARKREDGKVVCIEPNHVDSPLLTPDQNARMAAHVESANRAAMTEARNEQHEKELEAQGWCGSPKAALEAIEKYERMIGDEAARLAHQDRNLSERAKAEREAFEASTPEHVAVIPESRTVKIDKRTKEYKASQAKDSAAA